jgi:pimeloyl-ACP methyl ester carboxylesterase
MKPEFKSTRFGDGKLGYAIAGEGPDVVLIHGFPESSAIWEDYASRLSRRFRVICPDLPGLGRSSVLAEEHSMDLMAAAVGHILYTEGAHACVMAGHSMGGYVSLAFADTHPERLRGLVLMHSQAGADDEAARQNRMRAVELVNNDKAGFLHNFISNLFSPENIPKFAREIQSLIDVAGNTPADGITAAIKGMMTRPDRRGLLPTLNIPVAFIIGALDTRIPADKVGPQVFMPMHSEALILGRTAHMGFIEDAETVLRFLESFAERSFLIA